MPLPSFSWRHCIAGTTSSLLLVSLRWNSIFILRFVITPLLFFIPVSSAAYVSPITPSSSSLRFIAAIIGHGSHVCRSHCRHCPSYAISLPLASPLISRHAEYVTSHVIGLPSPHWSRLPPPPSATPAGHRITVITSLNNMLDTTSHCHHQPRRH